jgi:hypothetical protein
MTFSRDHYPKQIADRLHELATKLKTRTRARLTDANHSLETVMQRFFNALYGWNLVNLNAGQGDFPAADLGDPGRRVAMQITNEAAGTKIADTAGTAHKHRLSVAFGRLIIFFLLEKKPSVPKDFVQPVGGPDIECIDITDLLKQMQQMGDLGALKCAAAVLEEEMSASINATPLDRYFQALSENFSTYENLGLPPPANADGEKDIALPIRSLFVEPSCTKSRVSPEEFDAALLSGKNPAEPLLPLIAGAEHCTGAARRTVLLADPGMGKSTLIQWIIATLAAKAQLPLLAEGLRGAIPLPFILRDLVHHLPKDSARWDWPALLTAFRNYHPRAAGRSALTAALTADEALFASILDSERAFFLIDGLDEIGDPNHRRALRNGLWEGFDQHRAARWLITSRVVGYDEAVVNSVEIERDEKGELTAEEANEIRKTLLAARIPEEPWMLADHEFDGVQSVEKKFAQLLYLAPFDDAQQIAFARHWYIPRLGDVPGEERSTGFVHAVRQHPSVRVIGRVPNLLYLLALLYRHKAHLPNGRALVYAAISEAYLEGIDLDRHLDGYQTIPYKLGEKIRFLATIARHMQNRRAIAQSSDDDTGTGEVLVTREELEEWLTPYFPGEHGSVALHAFVSYVAARSGLLLPRGEGLFGFAHLSFQEYYAACWLEDEFRRLLNAQARGSGIGFLRRTALPEPVGSLKRESFAELAANPVWHEPLVFLVEKLSANIDDTLTLIDWLFPQLAQIPVTAQSEKPPVVMSYYPGRLLAALSVDPQVALTIEQRQGIWHILWRTQLASKAIRLAGVLLSASEFQTHVWSTLALLKPRFLRITKFEGLTNLVPLASFSELQSLSLRGCTGLVDLSPLTGLVELHTLSLRGCISVADLSPLKRLAQLRSLDLTGCKGVVELEPLSDLRELRALWLDDAGVINLAPLGNLTKLHLLALDHCTGVVDLAPLAGLQQLHTLQLIHCTGVTDLKPLGALSQLKKLHLRGCSGLSHDKVSAFRQSHPSVKVHGP